MEIFAYGKRQF